MTITITIQITEWYQPIITGAVTTACFCMIISWLRGELK